MPTETLSPVTIQEASAQPEVQFGSKHLEAAFTFKLNDRMHEILDKFKDGKIPPLPRGDLNITLPASEKCFQKAYGLLQRNQPAEITLDGVDLSRDDLIAIADGLAYTGIENSLVTSHLRELKKAVLQLGLSGTNPQETSALKQREKALKLVALEDNHFYRDFFNSELAERLGVDSPQSMTRFLTRASRSFNETDSMADVARGLSLEIAAIRYIANRLDPQDTETVVAFGDSQQDRQGGDIVVARGEKILYIDLKSSPPADLTELEIKQGYKLHNDSDGQFYKATAWAESRSPVDEDRFRLNDPALQSCLNQLLSEIS